MEAGLVVRVFLTFTWLVPFLSCTSVQESKFKRDSICNVQERIDEGCSKELPKNRRRLLRCLADCAKQIRCIGASIEKSTGMCYIHEMCSPQPVCSHTDTDHDYYSSYCVHGVWNTTTGACQCTMGTFGDRCNKAHNKCDTLKNHGHPIGDHLVYIDPRGDGNLYEIFCTMAGWGSTLRVFYNPGFTMPLNRTWSEYLRGFPSPTWSGYYWIGLNAWHAVSTYSPCQRVSFRLRFDFTTRIVMNYYKFKVGGKDENYSFTFDGTHSYSKGNVPGNSTAGDCMSDLMNLAFSTWDNDNDGNDSVHCASEVGRGWWHPQACNSSCNLMAWSLEDWNNTPSHQRFSMKGVDVAEAASEIMDFTIYITYC